MIQFTCHECNNWTGLKIAWGSGLGVKIGLGSYLTKSGPDFSC